MLSMFTVSKRNLKCAFQEFQTFHFTCAAVAVLNKTKELNILTPSERIQNNPTYYKSIGNISLFQEQISASATIRSCQEEDECNHV